MTAASFPCAVALTLLLATSVMPTSASNSCAADCPVGDLADVHECVLDHCTNIAPSGITACVLDNCLSLALPLLSHQTCSSAGSCLLGIIEDCDANHVVTADDIDAAVASCSGQCIDFEGCTAPATTTTATTATATSATSTATTVTTVTSVTVTTATTATTATTITTATTFAPPTTVTTVTMATFTSATSVTSVTTTTTIIAFTTVAAPTTITTTTTVSGTSVITTTETATTVSATEASTTGAETTIAAQPTRPQEVSATTTETLATTEEVNGVSPTTSAADASTQPTDARTASTTAASERMSTAAPAVSATAEALSGRVSVRMTVAGIDYGLLVEDQELLESFGSAARGTFASRAMVAQEYVDIRISSGSVVVGADIWVPLDLGLAVEDVRDALQSSSTSSSLGDSLVQAVNHIDGITFVTDGKDISVVDVTLSLEVSAGGRTISASGDGTIASDGSTRVAVASVVVFLTALRLAMGI